MRIKMVKGKDFIEWTLLGSGANAYVRQVDKTGVYRKDFDTAQVAGLWIIDQALFASNEMGYTFTAE